jgi:hypothetical protein
VNAPEKRPAETTLRVAALVLAGLVVVVLYGVRWCWRRFE